MTPIFQVDAFTATPFRGNPAAVCLLDGEREARWMQALAAEMNLSETAFVRPLDVAAGEFGLRWFTPAQEVNLCGHATLASAHILWESGRLPAEREARFRTRSGTLSARRTAEGIELDFPADPTTPLAEGEGEGEGLAAILGRRVVSAHRGRENWLVELESAEAVRGCRPNLERVRALPAHALIVTARGGEGADFVSRFFAPAVGVDEDPVTGSAHCALACYWAQRLGRTTMAARQLSARGGELTVRLDGERVRLTGQAVTVLSGELRA